MEAAFAVGRCPRLTHVFMCMCINILCNYVTDIGR